MLQVFALGQTHVHTLARREDAGQVSGQRQVIGVATHQHHGGKRTTQGLVQGQDDQLFVVRIRRREIAPLQAGLHPGAEVGQVQGRLRPGYVAQTLERRRLARGVAQAQGLQHQQPCAVGQ